jgi:hypothetical protein
VYRTLADWRHRGLVSTDTRKVIVHDEIGIRRIAGWSI